MKTKTKLFTYLAFVLFLGIAISSCEGPEGPQGEQGIQGIQGLPGLDGADGTDGADGADGTDGVNCWDTNGDGVQDPSEDINGDGEWNALDCQGTEGNSDVQVFVFNNPTWDASTMALNLPALTQEVIDTYLIQAYLGFPINNIPNSVYYDVPGAANGGAYYYRSWINVGTYTIKAVEAINTDNAYLNPDIASSAKILLIAPSSTTEVDGNGRLVSPQQAIYNELDAAGVDISDYFEVCAYYGINP